MRKDSKTYYSVDGQVKGSDDWHCIRKCKTYMAAQRTMNELCKSGAITRGRIYTVVHTKILLTDS